MPSIDPPATSEEAYKRGLACLERRTYQEAAACFQAAMDLDARPGQKSTDAKYLSYLGLSLNLAQVRSDEGLKMCEQAAKREFFDPDVFCNLGIAYLRHRQRGPAFQSFHRGLALRPKHRRIHEELERYERRGEPVFTFLRRDHALNVLGGRVRARLRALLGRITPNEA
jgi:tetratricopeptide (TPR) repeat protein